MWTAILGQEVDWAFLTAPQVMLAEFVMTAYNVLILGQPAGISKRKNTSTASGQGSRWVYCFERRALHLPLESRD